MKTLVKNAKFVILVVLVVMVSLFFFERKLSKASDQLSKIRMKEQKTAKKATTTEDFIPGTYDPRLLMPLALGNSWTYRWKSAATPTLKEVESKDKPIFRGLSWYSFGGKSVLARRYGYKAKAHKETYTIVRQDGDHYFFTISIDPKVPPEQIRDGRFEDSVENCWTWWDRRQGSYGSMGMTESIKRNWGIHRDYLLGKQAELPDDFPADHRNAIHIEFTEGEWGDSWLEFAYSKNPCRYVYKTMGNEIKVAVGTFKNCIEVIEKVHKDAKEKSPLVWETHIFWAPEVGKVWEYQKLADGTITYELELLKFVPAKKKK